MDKLEFINKENLSLIKALLEQELKEKGITHSEENPDIVVNIFAIAHDQIKESKYPQNNDYVIQSGSSYIANPAKTKETIMGSLFLDIYNASNNEPIWQAGREKIISSDPESNRRILENSIKSMLSAFPPND